MTVITATSRLSRELRKAYDQEQEAAGLSCWPAAQILSLPAWLQDLWKAWLFSDRMPAASVRLLWPSEEQVIWEEIIRTQTGNRLLDIPATAVAALRSWELLCSWRLPLDAPEWRDSADASAFQAWAVEFRKRCLAQGWCSNAELPGVVADLIERDEVPVPEEVEFAGFHERTPGQQRLVDALAQRGVPVRDREDPETVRDAVRIGLADSARETRAAAEWARRTLETEPDAASADFQIGVVVPDLEARRSEIERIFGEVCHPRTRLRSDQDPARCFNISLGLPLDAYPIIQAAFQILETDPREIPIEHAGRLLRSPFLNGAEREMTNRALLDVTLRARRQMHVSMRDVLDSARQKSAAYYCPGILSRFRAWPDQYRTLQTPRMPSDWAPVFSDFLREIGWPGDRAIDSIEYQTIEVWKELLSELARLDGVSGPVALRAAIDLLRSLATSRLFQPESVTAPVQILGVFETAGLRFDRLWIMGMHDGAWPGLRSPDPFLPLRMQHRFKVRGASPARELAFHQRFTDRLLASAQSAVVSYPEREGDSDLRPSPLLTSLPEVGASDLGLIAWESYADRLLGSSRTEILEDHRGPPCGDAEVRGGTLLFKLQAACPFKAFAELRLGARPPDVPEPGLDAMDRGQLVHRIMERIWEQLRTREELRSMAGDALDAMVRQHVLSEIRHHLGDRALRNPRFAKIEQERLEGIVGEWLLLERDRKPFTVLEQEEKRRVEVGGIVVGIRADRVDRLDGGELVVIDYKTGACSPSDWDGERPNDPQLPVYAVTSDAAIAGLFFAKLKAGEIRFSGRARSGEIVPGVRGPDDDTSMADSIESWRKVLERLGDDYNAGRAHVDPKDPAQTCRYCALPSLCRVG